MSATTPLRIGLLGAGRIGKVHAAAIGASPMGQLVAVSDAIDEAASELAASTGAAVRDADGIIGAGDVDAVLIATPTDTHADLIEATAAAGQIIFCEKPLDLDVERARACLQTVASLNARLMLGFNRRFDPNHRAVKDAVERGDVGDVEMVTIISRDPGAPPLSYLERSGGLFKDMTIHDFDMARFLLGEEPVAVSAAGSTLTDPQIAEVPDIDSAAVTLTTASGRIAQISNSRRAAYGYDQRVEVLGSKGMVSSGNIHESTVEVATAGGFGKPPLMNFFLERYMASYRAEIDAFVDAAHNGDPMDPSGDDGLRALVLAEAAAKSWREGRTIEVSSFS
jgi:myo-inositol 2-dehydrogenase/D-chiro-inositol 1-dehydrogenase